MQTNALNAQTMKYPHAKLWTPKKKENLIKQSMLLYPHFLYWILLLLLLCNSNSITCSTPHSPILCIWFHFLRFFSYFCFFFFFFYLHKSNICTLHKSHMKTNIFKLNMQQKQNMENIISNFAEMINTHTNRILGFFFTRLWLLLNLFFIFK